jgi:hypothetical protein
MGGALQDGLEQLLLVEAVDEAEGGFVERGQVVVPAAQGAELRAQAVRGRLGFLRRAAQGVGFGRRGRGAVGSFSVQPNLLNASGTAVKADGDVPVGDDNRHPALVLRVLQHGGHAGGVLQHVDEFHRTAVAGIGFPSRPGVGSGVFSENPHRVAHRSSFLSPARQWRKKTTSRLPPCQ